MEKIDYIAEAREEFLSQNSINKDFLIKITQFSLVEISSPSMCNNIFPQYPGGLKNCSVRFQLLVSLSSCGIRSRPNNPRASFLIFLNAELLSLGI